MEVESLKKGKSTVEKCLEELFKKDDLTPQETKAALDGMNLREMLMCEIENCKMQEEMPEYSERGYSGHGYGGEWEPTATPRKYNIISYGNRARPTSVMYSGKSMKSYTDGYSQGYREGMADAGYSGDYGVQGWYRSADGSYCPPDYYYGVPGRVSHGSVSTTDGSYRRGYSRHSIGDRAVERLEQMMDQAGSDYEKEELHKFIRLIREAAD